ncbi:MAG TPA: DPP IV N-terminal domain-containing protein [Patescibacteria group bacterium]|nr:DPP IV N-terminal domain-containing protein [Patescibacteria group bacterium]
MHKFSPIFTVPLIIIFSFIVGFVSLGAMLNLFLFPFRVESASIPHDYILYVSDKTGNQDIYSYDLVTKESANLTDHAGDDMNPQLSPDGKTMIFYSDRSGTNQIYSMSLTTHKTIRLTFDNGEDYDPSFSPTGHLIVFKSTRDDKRGDIFLMQANGRDQTNLTPWRDLTEEWDPIFSSDGKKIIFVSRHGANAASDEIFSMDLDGKNLQQLTKNSVSDWYPSINPQTGQIAFVSKDPVTHTDAIFTMNLDGSHKKVISHPLGNSDDPSWDTTGKKIIFINQTNNDAIYTVYTMNADGTDTKQIIKTHNDELSPLFSPAS